MSEEEFKRRLTAILNADVAGYSRLMQDDEEGTIRTLNSYRNIITNLVLMHRGRVVDTPGDNLLAEFPSIVDAIRCSVEIQREIDQQNAEIPDDRKMQFRIGIDLGDVIEEDDQIYGDGINIAARLEKLAEVGGICISGRAYDQVEDKLDLEYEFLGEHDVKNIKRPIRVYRISKELKRLTKEGKVKDPYSKIEKPSIAILPFVNISNDPNQEYFCDGLTEDIITALSKTSQMFVIARNSTFSYKGKSVKANQIAEELGVRYVLEGSVRKSGDRLRIATQLIDALTGHHLWAERYDRKLKDIFAVQDEITIQIISALQVKLTDGELAAIRARGTENLEAYLKSSQVNVYSNRWTKEDNLKARQIAEEIIALDPNYANGYTLLGWSYWQSVYYGWSESPREFLGKAHDLAQKSISLDDNLETSHRLLGCVYQAERRLDKAMAEFERAVAVAPNSSNALAGMGFVFNQTGKFREAIKPLETAVALDPIPQVWFFLNLGFAYYVTGKINEMIEVCHKAINVGPTNPESHVLLGIAFLTAGKPGEAFAVFDKVLSLDQHPSGWAIGNHAIALVNAGRSEEALMSMKDLDSLRPSDADCCWLFSVALNILGRHQEALQMAQRGASMKRGPSSRTMNSLGLSYLMLEQYDQAMTHYKKAIKRWRDYVWERIGLAASYSLAGRMEEAHAEALEILKINPQISLDDIAKNGYFNFQTQDKNRFIGALRNAGLM